MNVIEVETGKVAVALSPYRLRASALGSCVACVLYDSVHKIGGIAHIMLASSNHYIKYDDTLKYADLAIPHLINKMVDTGADRNRLHARLVGGAMLIKATLNIGEEVLASIDPLLTKYGVNIVAKRVGGRVHRSATLDTSTGILWYSENNSIEHAL
jgi:chemotaxis protein CheD